VAKYEATIYRRSRGTTATPRRIASSRQLASQSAAHSGIAAWSIKAPIWGKAIRSMTRLIQAGVPPLPTIAVGWDQPSSRPITLAV
jgi:hypothetical protein